MIDTLRTEWPADLQRASGAADAGGFERIANDAVDRLKDYARENPTGLALWAFGIGFVLGWRLKPW